MHFSVCRFKNKILTQCANVFNQNLLQCILAGFVTTILTATTGKFYKYSHVNTTKSNRSKNMSSLTGWKETKLI